MIRIVRNDAPRSAPASVSENITPPKVLTRVEPIYTPEAAAARVAGRVIIRVAVDERGTVTNADVLKGLPFGLDRSTVDAVRSWTFAPALDRNGIPVKGTFHVVMNFPPK